ncbi:hypothetical protein KZ850_20810, partial [Pseudomonas aeruginosa]|nr:hypothetical protein [Pseudomonas aeruginosa]
MGRFVGKQADGYETRIGRLLPGYELLHLLSRAQLLARLPERARLLLSLIHISEPTRHSLISYA